MKIHLIGIGGIGVSALAQYYLSKGHEVSGSDLVTSEIMDFLKAKGIKININPKESPDLVVYSPAVKKDNPELKFYREKGVKCLSYPEALGEITKEYFTIAIAGAHGKSTTTAMIALVLAKAGLDPTVVVGTRVKEFGNSNFRAGKSKLLVIEACEYDSSFLRYSPKIIVVTNVDKEHLDYFKTFANVKKAFKDFIARLPANGFLVFNEDDKNINKIFNFQGSIFNKFSIKQFSIKQKEAGKLKKILRIPGEHNVSNALAALKVARILGVPDEISFKALSEFRGTWRRFEIKKGRAGNKKITAVSDYGHHPTEVLATLKAAREKYPKNPPSSRLIGTVARQRKIWCVFQPHQRQRTYYLFNDFVRIFRQAQDSYFIDRIIVTDIYDVAGREKRGISKKINSQKLVEKIDRKDIIYLPLADIESFVKDNIKNGDVLIIMGAGDIYKLTDEF
ncbi:MAG: UDP-N-acetylmuramate--alanine ligase [Parcubacteria group bacterium Licking1014_1]|nr:MAG: UDP-N-acetylmuramate--alanine ligase [Parcubacteria group bacterium Licking1014_1]